MPRIAHSSAARGLFVSSLPRSLLSAPALCEDPGRLLLGILAAKAYVLLILFVLFLRSDVRRGPRPFLFTGGAAGPAARLAAAQADFFERLSLYDGQYYRDIARNGYRLFGSADGPEKPARGNLAFFPFLPLVLRAAEAAFGRFHLAVVIGAGVLASALGVYVTARIAGALGVSPAWTALFLVAFPAAIFQCVLYTEGWFLLFSALALEACLRRRLGRAAAWGALAGLVRPQGILLALALLGTFALPALRSGGATAARRLKAVVLSLSPASGFAAMAVISLSVTGDPLGFIEIQADWGRSAEPANLFSALRSAWGYKGPPFDVAGLVFALVFFPAVWRRLPRPFGLYAAGSVFLPLLTGALLSFGRFVSVSIPHFLALAAVLAERRRLRWAAAGLLVLLQLFMAEGLIRWHLVG